MKLNLRQIAVLLSTLLAITINGLANALPFNGITTGEVSDSFNTYFVPAGYVFSIWGLIYIGLILFSIYQASPARRDNPRLSKVGWWVVIGNLANATWMFFWHYQFFGWTLVAMLTLLASLLLVYTGLRSEKSVSPADFWLASVPFSIYLGWISVATIANISDVLYYYRWGQFGITAEIWMVVMLAVVAALAWIMTLRQRDWAYLAVLLWALAGIGVKFPANGIVTTAIWASFGVVALAFLWALILIKRTEI